MAQNFSVCDREEELLLPPSLREWLPEGHLAWCVIDAVAQFDLAAFYGDYRDDGHSRPAHDAAMMVALLLYCYALGKRSSRRIERRCIEDVAMRVITANRAPDHATIARFRQGRETALAGLCGAGLALCAEVSLVWVGVIRSTGRRFMRTRPSARRAITSRSRARSLPRPTRLTAKRMSASANAAATSSRSSSRPVVARQWLAEAKRRLAQQRADEGRPIPPHGASSPRGAPSSVEKQTG